MKSFLLTVALPFLVAVGLAALMFGWGSLMAAPAQNVVTVPSGMLLAEVPPCGASPCSLNATSTIVLAANPNRAQCLIQNVSTAVFYCSQGTSTGPGFDFILKAATATSTGDGGSYTCNQGPATWRGLISCMPSVTSSPLAVSAASAQGR